MEQTYRNSMELKAKLFRGFSDASRLCILESLGTGAKCVSEIVEATGLSQPNVSNHLACLRECGLVSCDQQGRSVYYRLSDQRVKAFLELADTLLADVARGVYDCVRYRSGSSANNPQVERHLEELY